MHIQKTQKIIAIAALFFPAAPFLEAQSISAADAAGHIGERATVCGTIAGEHTAYSSRGTPTFIDLDRPYPAQPFTILVWGSDRDRVGALPAGGRICAAGVVTEYRGRPEIVVRDPGSWSVPR